MAPRLIRVVTRISPNDGTPEGFSRLAKPTEFGDPIPVERSNVIDPRNGREFLIETFFCFAKPDSSVLKETDWPDIPGLVSASDLGGLGDFSGGKFAFSVPKVISGKKIRELLSVAEHKDKSSIKIHIDLKKIRESRQSTEPLETKKIRKSRESTESKKSRESRQSPEPKKIKKSHEPPEPKMSRESRQSPEPKEIRESLQSPEPKKIKKSHEPPEQKKNHESRQSPEPPEPKNIKKSRESSEPKKNLESHQSPEPKEIRESLQSPEPPDPKKSPKKVPSKKILLKRLLRYFVENECLICGKISEGATRHRIRSHMASHLAPKGYRCQRCGATFSGATDLYTHVLREEESEEYRCDRCDETYKRKYLLTIHHQDAHSEGITSPPDKRGFLLNQEIPTCFSCSICSKSFTTWKSIRGHQGAHPDEQQSFQCLICCKSFPVGCLLRYHSHQRVVNRCHACNLCSKTFPTLLKLLKHKKNTHAKQKKHPCAICGKKFNFRGSLRKHTERIHASG